MAGTERGVVYVATDAAFAREASVSAQTVKRELGEIQTLMFTDKPRELKAIDQQIVVEEPVHGFGDKVQYLSQSPFEKTLYLDTDTFLARDVNDIFALLDNHDIAVAHDPMRAKTEGAITGVPDAYPEFNTGVLAFTNSEATEDLFRRWKTIYQSSSHRPDQPSFRKAAYASSVRIATLPPEYNCLFTMPGVASGPVRIFHGRLLADVVGEKAARNHIYDVQQAVETVNKTTEHRLFMQSGGLRILRNEDSGVFERLVGSLRRQGLRWTLREGVKQLRA